MVPDYGTSDTAAHRLCVVTKVVCWRFWREFGRVSWHSRPAGAPGPQRNGSFARLAHSLERTLSFIDGFLRNSLDFVRVSRLAPGDATDFAEVASTRSRLLSISHERHAVSNLFDQFSNQKQIRSCSRPLLTSFCFDKV